MLEFTKEKTGLERRNTFFGDWEVDPDTLRRNKKRLLHSYNLSLAGARENTDNDNSFSKS